MPSPAWTRPARSYVLAALALAIVGMSCAAPLVRLSTSAPLTIAAWRLLLSLGIVGTALAVEGSWREWRTLTRRELGWCVLAGVLLAVHFWSWNVSLRLTSVAASVVLVSMQPIIVLPLAARWLGERATRGQRLGVLLAVAGACVVAAGDGLRSLLGGFGSGRALLGDGLALLGAATGAGYYLIGRRVRARLSLWPYVGIVYATCALLLVIAAPMANAPLWPVSLREFLIFAGLAIGPMLLGHTGLNWALGHAPAYLVNVAVLGEPVGATLLAWLLPGIAERPPALALLGGTIVLAGLVLATRRDPEPTRTD